MSHGRVGDVDAGVLRTGVIAGEVRDVEKTLNLAVANFRKPGGQDGEVFLEVGRVGKRRLVPKRSVSRRSYTLRRKAIGGVDGDAPATS